MLAIECNHVGHDDLANLTATATLGADGSLEVRAWQQEGPSRRGRGFRRRERRLFSLVYQAPRSVATRPLPRRWSWARCSWMCTSSTRRRVRCFIVCFSGRPLKLPCCLCCPAVLASPPPCRPRPSARCCAPAGCAQMPECTLPFCLACNAAEAEGGRFEGREECLACEEGYVIDDGALTIGWPWP